MEYIVVVTEVLNTAVMCGLKLHLENLLFKCMIA